MQLKEYDGWLEIATGSTILRDRRFGRGAELFQHLLEEAKKRDAEAVFGVGINPKLEDKLIPLGFKELAHEDLPQSWQDQYDKGRKSRAFALFL